MNKYLKISIIILWSTLSAQAQAGDLSNPMLKEINEAINTFSSKWSAGKCGSIKTSYQNGNESLPDQLVVSFTAESGPVSFTVYGVEAQNNNWEAPGLSWIKSNENGNSRIDYVYVSYIESDTDLNSSPSTQGSYYLKVNFSIYPEAKQLLQVAIWVTKGKPDRKPKTVLWSQLVGFDLENCKN